MDRLIYTAMTGAKHSLEQQATVAHNLANVSTTAFKAQLSGATKRGNKAGAQALGKTIAQRVIDKGIKRVVFDRGGFLYHGRIRAVAEAAREAGLEF